MPLHFCCPCLNVRVSVRSVSQNLPPFAAEMVVARRAFELGPAVSAAFTGGGVGAAGGGGGGGARPTPSAIARLSVGGLTMEHAALVRATPVPGAKRWSTVRCLLCNTKVACTSSGGSAIVNSKLSLTDTDLKRRQADPRYCRAFNILVVNRRRTPASASDEDEVAAATAAAAAAAARIDGPVVDRISGMADDFVQARELEVKRRVEVYYAEEQAKLRAMHRQLKLQMASLTEQIAKVMAAEAVYQQQVQDGLYSSDDQQYGSGISPASTASAKSPPSPAVAAPPTVIRVPGSPRTTKTRAVMASEQETRDRFTAPRLTELNMRGDELDSPTEGPAAAPAEAPGGEAAGTAAADGSAVDGGSSTSSTSTGTGSTNNNAAASAAAAEGGATEGVRGATGDNTDATENGSSSAAVAAMRRTSLNSNDSSVSSHGSGPFALTPPAVIDNTSGSAGSRNLLGENGSPERRSARGIRRKLNRGSKASGNKSKAMMSTTAPARSDVGFAFFAKRGVEDLFVMDEDMVAEQEDEDEDEDEEEDEAPGELVDPLKREINWAPTPATQMMSQSYAAPAARDWWGGSSDSDSEDEILGLGSGERKERPRVESASSTDGAASDGPSMTGGVFGGGAAPSAPAVAPAPADNFYGSSMPMAIPSMGGRRRKR